MGIIQKQSIQNGLILGLGVSIGFVNVLLSPKVFTAEEYGLFQLLISISILSVQLFSFGLPSIIGKYLSHYREEGYASFVAWLTRFAVICFAAFVVAYWSFRVPISQAYQNKSALFLHYFYHVIPFVFFAFVFNLLEVIARGFYQSVFSAFLKEPFLKSFNLLGLVLFSFKIISFEGFIDLYIFGNALMCILLLLQLNHSGALPMVVKTDIDIHHSKPMISYGWYLFWANLAWIVVNKIDVLLLSQQIGLSAAGVYAYFALWASLIRLPTNAINRISYQVIADAWAKQQMTKINDIYQKTSLIQMIVGVLIFIGITLNQHNIIAIIGSKNEYVHYFDLFYIVGASVLIDVTGGLNGQIVMLSKEHKIATWFSAIAFLVCLISNYIGIKYAGVYGSAWALLLTIAFYNFCNWWYIRMRFKMQPFNSKYLYIIAIGIITWAVMKTIPQINHIFADIAIRSILIIVFYARLIIKGNLSEDVNRVYSQSINQTILFFQNLWKPKDNKN